MLKKDQKLLLKLTRNTLEMFFKDNDPDTSDYSHFTDLKGCFVTLHKNKELRGCIGFVKPIMPLFEQIIAATKAAAFEDSRFDPLEESELKSLKIEISLLSIPEQIKNDPLKSIEIGKDGLIIEYMNHFGLLLPQVATQYNWNALQFLEALCNKAMLGKNDWKQAKLFKFQAEVFSE